MTTSANSKVLLFDIERFSTKDGPGIRTVVFFKGCNMRCFWCHNPEGIAPQMSLEFDEDKCIGCMYCLKACPTGAHSFIQGHHIINPEKCRLCFSCADVCYSGALQRVGRTMDINELFAEINEDRIFYDHSGGGITLSGGEVMMQHEFASQILSLCKQNQIHTAIETNMSFPWREYEKVLPNIDLVMTDIKHMEDGCHRQGTGISNQPILANILKLGEIKKPLIVRTPVIPGYNDIEENIAQTAEFLKGITSMEYFELLSYNPLGNAKGVIVGSQNNNSEISVPSKSKMRSLAAIARKVGIKVFLDGHEY